MRPRPLGAAVPDEESDGVAVGEAELLVALHQESGVSKVLVTLVCLHLISLVDSIVKEGSSTASQKQV